jgi:hypothetical protein
MPSWLKVYMFNKAYLPAAFKQRLTYPIEQAISCQDIQKIHSNSNLLSHKASKAQRVTTSNKNLCVLVSL